MQVVKVFGLISNSNTKIPLFSMSVAAGIPVPAENDIESSVDLNEFLIEHPASTFFAHVAGDNLKANGIEDGDILIVDTAIKPQNGKTVVVMLGSDLSVKIYRENEGVPYLQTDNERFIPLKIEGGFEFKIIGVVTKVIHSI
jgi:DNA polymerase V